ncbi:hypothetical protein BDF19DRAFT_442640 [Syncephalis fuscata]|nr:hypothetical protein BDF19DRAFT_442640 [Syncephalis fuscata]
MATNRVFSKSMLYLSCLKFSANDFKPAFVNGHWRKPRISLRRQADLRKACLIQGKTPEDYGLPSVKENKPLRVKPPKGTKYQRNYEERKMKVEKSLGSMSEKIADWKEASLNERIILYLLIIHANVYIIITG